MRFVAALGLMLQLAPSPAAAIRTQSSAQGKAQPVQTAPCKNNYFPAVLDNWILKISTIRLWVFFLFLAFLLLHIMNARQLLGAVGDLLKAEMELTPSFLGGWRWEAEWEQ